MAAPPWHTGRTAAVHCTFCAAPDTFDTADATLPAREFSPRLTKKRRNQNAAISKSRLGGASRSLPLSEAPAASALRLKKSPLVPFLAGSPRRQRQSLSRGLPSHPNRSDKQNTHLKRLTKEFLHIYRALSAYRKRTVRGTRTGGQKIDVSSRGQGAAGARRSGSADGKACPARPAQLHGQGRVGAGRGHHRCSVLHRAQARGGKAVTMSFKGRALVLSSLVPIKDAHSRESCTRAEQRSAIARFSASLQKQEGVLFAWGSGARCHWLRVAPGSGAASFFFPMLLSGGRVFSRHAALAVIASCTWSRLLVASGLEGRESFFPGQSGFFFPPLFSSLCGLRVWVIRFLPCLANR